MRRTPRWFATHSRGRRPGTSSSPRAIRRGAASPRRCRSIGGRGRSRSGSCASGSGKADDRAADRVAEALGDLPLALEQAAAYCEQTGTTLTGYADLLEQGYGAELWREPRDLERTVAAVWEVSFSKVEADSPAGAALLKLCAFLAPDNIPLDAIRAGAADAAGAAEGVAARPVAFNTAVGALLRYSLARRDGEMLSVHRLVQAVTRDRLTGRGARDVGRARRDSHE